MLLPVVYGISFIFLLLNQSRYIFGGDSAEFSFIARTWSVAHPPGYPFYSLLINIVNHLLPFGTTPWKIATISSLSTVITSIIIYLLLRRLNIKKPIALFSSLFYIILFPVWQYSEIPEVFTLHNLLMAAITYCLFVFSETKNKKYLFVSAFLLGLSISHHHIFVLFVPAFAYLLLRKQGKKRLLLTLKKKDIIVTALLVLAGVSFYLYPPIASRFSPPLDWENAKTLTGFFRLITRAAYGTFKAYSGSSGNIANQIYDIVSLFIFMVMDFRIIGILCIAIGMVVSRRSKNPFHMFLFIAFITHVFFLFYSNFLLSFSFTLAMYERFLIPLYLVLIFYLAFGLQAVENGLVMIKRKYIQNDVLSTVTSAIFPLLITLYFAIVFLSNFQTMRLIPSLDIFVTYAKNLLDTPPKNSIFFVGADNSHFTTIYYYFAEHYRSDLRYVFINQLDKKHYRDYFRKLYPDIYIPEPYDAKKFQEFIDKNASRGIYMENPYGASWKPYGLLWKEYGNESAAISDSAKLVRDNNYLWQHIYTIPQLSDSLKKILHLDVVRGQYLADYLNYSRLLFATDHIEEARQAVALISRYQQSDIRTKFILVNLYLYEGRCREAEAIINEVTLPAALAQPDILPSLHDYYHICKPKDHDTAKEIDNAINGNKKSISEF